MTATSTSPFLLVRSNAALLASVDDPSVPPRRVSWGKRVCLFLAAFQFALVFFGAAGFFLLVGFIDSAHKAWADGEVAMVVVLLLLGLIAFATGTIPIFLHNYRRLRDGRVIVGQVLSCKVNTNTYRDDTNGTGSEWSSTTFKMEFSFVTPGGKTITGCVRLELPAAPKHSPTASDAMAVLYLDDDNYQVL
jgi:hypothetical protein